MDAISEKLMDIYERLHEHFGPRHWWPGDSPFEVMVGAVLTQNTAWKNVEKAIANLKRASVLSLEALVQMPLARLAALIRPAGYFNIKAKRLSNLLHAIAAESTESGESGWPISTFLALEISTLRERLLSTSGIGPETADSIILYAAEKPIFVVDAYTKRLLLRHSLIDEEADYHAIQSLFMDHLPHDVPLFNEYHALIVETGKTYCTPNHPKCHICPLGVLLKIQT